MRSLVSFVLGFVHARDQAALPLLGGGIDDIIQRTPRAPNDAQRLLRYAHAKYLFYTRAPGQLPMLALRTRLGEHYRDAWRAGRFPRFRAMGHPPAVHFLKRSEARAP